MERRKVCCGCDRDQSNGNCKPSYSAANFWVQNESCFLVIKQIYKTNKIELAQ